ncbi:antitoxin component of MazEF toxin-antitoxin module [Enterococcus sp. PF1-24]|uniref:AbrB/MazE/SpoVT family DNA-binding domain-containing protein n=1 Tax=unclassified Enterococcus TaxID=2608891 RepID=UPI002474EAB8|nr:MULTISPECIES: AbrB family transcriptional regulator [unclassified Enterococcus]MDH6365814.1 antitoxin component of MazEF toxin-antitoxin module [Enterococcus sp. PFB1-1]MDH6402918.1 antitoxin component of MazEF toxin-antitoxin module [Enterococcus sp. PF1-24]
MGQIKIRKIGNSLGAIFPKDWNLTEGDVLNYEKKGTKYILDGKDIAREHDRLLVEESFADFETNNTVTEAEMAEIFKKYDWGK